MHRIQIILSLLVLVALASCRKEENDKPDGSIQLFGIKAGDVNFNLNGTTSQISINSVFVLSFSSALDQQSAEESILLKNENQLIELNSSFSSDRKTITLTPITQLEYSTNYQISISNSLKGASNESFPGIEIAFQTQAAGIIMESITINGLNFRLPQKPNGIDYQEAIIDVLFSEPVKSEDIEQYFSFIPLTDFIVELSEENKKVTITTTEDFDYYKRYFFTISSGLQALNGASFQGFSNQFITGLNPNYKMPSIDDEALLTLVQQQTFKYFWDYAHPVSGLSRERYGSGDIVTIGGSGFGLMGIIVGAERGFISRQQAVAHFEKVTSFLAAADRFHGAWPHWLNGTTGNVYPFSTYDDGADLVETSFLASGLICVRQYLDINQADEEIIITRINNMLDQIEWDWFTRGGLNELYWHWSPNHNWAMNMKVSGYCEALITHFLAASSVTHPLPASVYHNGWARNGGIINGNSFYDILLPVGYNYGGPLFFAHYSFLGLNPQNLSDQYANYWTQNVNHSLINQKHCIINPKNYLGYSAECWGLTASDDPSGYKVHEPANDNGTISPTAAISSLPYTPEASMAAIKHFYFILGDKLWGQFGFYDAFNPSESWWANSYLAIDQGPILVMIENYRTGLCWDLFMSSPEAQRAMEKLGFSR